MKRELVLLIALFGCGDNSESVPDRPPGEAALRTKLGVPTHAKRVIVFGCGSFASRSTRVIPIT